MDHPKPLMGVRMWYAEERQGGPYLTSTGIGLFGGGGRWEPDEDKGAMCTRRDHDAPDKDCQCGLYAYYNLTTLSNYGDRNHLRSGNIVIGLISAWGKVVACEYGFRAQCARVEAIVMNKKYVHILHKMIPVTDYFLDLSSALGVPLVNPEDIDAFAEERGLSVVLPSTIAIALDQSPPPGCYVKPSLDGYDVTHIDKAEYISNFFDGKELS